LRHNIADFYRAVYHEKKTRAAEEKLTGVANLEFRHTASYRISRILGQFKIKRVHIPFKKTSRMVTPAKIT
jgi:hypothetical protein